MIKKTFIWILMILMLSSIVHAGLEETTFTIGLKQKSDVRWLIYDYSDLFPTTTGYATDFSLSIDMDKTTFSEIPNIQYILDDTYSWYDPGFSNRYEMGASPVLLDYCMVIPSNPDEVTSGEYFDSQLSNNQNSAEMFVEIFRDFTSYKTYYDNAGGSPDNECWQGDFKVYCWIYLDEDYISNDAVMDYYGWDVTTTPNVDDVMDLSITSNCNKNGESYCLISISYPWYLLDLDLTSDECIVNGYNVPDGLGFGLNITTDIYENTESQINMSGGSVNGESATDEDAEGNKGGESEGTGDGYQYLKVQDYILEKEIQMQHLNYIATLLNIMKLIYSLVLILFYFVELLILTYFIGVLVPGIFKRIEEILTKGGKKL